MLKEEIQAVVGKRRKFLLLRICDVEPEIARKLCGIKKGTYTSWLQDSKFVVLYRRRKEFSGLYKEEAIRLLRRDNQLNAVLLEEEILNRIKDEIASGDYNLVRLPLARDVYAKLIGDLDYQPQSLALTWEQRLQQIFQGGRQEISDGQAEVVEAEACLITEHPEGNHVEEGEQAYSSIEETVQA